MYFFLADIDKNLEEGEAAPEPVLNVEKIIEYPGFTVEAPEDVFEVSHAWQTSDISNIFLVFNFSVTEK